MTIKLLNRQKFKIMRLYRIGLNVRVYKFDTIAGGYNFAAKYGGKYNKLTKTVTI